MLQGRELNDLSKCREALCVLEGVSRVCPEGRNHLVEDVHDAYQFELFLRRRAALLTVVKLSKCEVCQLPDELSHVDNKRIEVILVKTQTHNYYADTL